MSLTVTLIMLLGILLVLSFDILFMNIFIFMAIIQFCTYPDANPHPDLLA